MSIRKKAWRNLMLASINEGLEQNIFGLDSGSGPTANAPSYEFSIAGLPVIAHAFDIGFDEIRINAIVSLYDQRTDLVLAGNITSFWFGDAVATGWLERRTGKWLQTSSPLFRCRREVSQLLANVTVKPNGYLAEGKFFL